MCRIIRLLSGPLVLVLHDRSSRDTKCEKVKKVVESGNSARRVMRCSRCRTSVREEKMNSSDGLTMWNNISKLTICAVTPAWPLTFTAKRSTSVMTQSTWTNCQGSQIIISEIPLKIQSYSKISNSPGTFLDVRMKRCLPRKHYSECYGAAVWTQGFGFECSVEWLQTAQEQAETERSWGDLTPGVEILQVF